MEDVYFETVEEGWRLINKAIEDGYNYANPLWPLEVIMEDIRNSLEPHPISLVIDNPNLYAVGFNEVDKLFYIIYKLKLG